MPSKTWSIMACNTPIIASFDTGSELDLIVSSANAGICVEPENPDKLSKTILEYKEKNNKKRMRVGNMLLIMLQKSPALINILIY